MNSINEESDEIFKSQVLPLVASMFANIDSKIKCHISKADRKELLTSVADKYKNEFNNYVDGMVNIHSGLKESN